MATTTTPGLEIRPYRGGRGWEIAHIESDTYLVRFGAKARATATLKALAAHDWNRPLATLRQDRAAMKAARIAAAREMLITSHGNPICQDNLARALALPDA